MTVTDIGSTRIQTEILRTPFSLYSETGDWDDLVSRQSVIHSSSVTEWLRHLREIGDELLGMTGGLRQLEGEHGRSGEWWTVLVHDRA